MWRVAHSRQQNPCPGEAQEGCDRLSQGSSQQGAAGSVCSRSTVPGSQRLCLCLKRLRSEQVSKQVIHLQHYVLVVKGISQW